MKSFDIADFLDRLGVSNYTIDWEAQVVFVPIKYIHRIQSAMDQNPESQGWKILQANLGKEWDFADCSGRGLWLHERY